MRSWGLPVVAALALIATGWLGCDLNPQPLPPGDGLGSPGGGDDGDLGGSPSNNSSSSGGGDDEPFGGASSGGSSSGFDVASGDASASADASATEFAGDASCRCSGVEGGGLPDASEDAGRSNEDGAIHGDAGSPAVDGGDGAPNDGSAPATDSGGDACQELPDSDAADEADADDCGCPQD